ncbi:electron transfer flavoprotein subunit alpha/FixB family protein [Acidianus sulfidivorans JP7]|uniref:Electron transfer flavoprotein subunit alpha n=1 Tax=Acidianus sulfidivorans JP7 TaxID=619593 RepID=A0A2U9IJF5_9CREN|nr:electron transfer flavoprotein subunit alpha/FixB family protein [Acidianus sulfidivorans]AWR96167.1 electron transfer flavoprotein subunit alpha/FixB family protein [Acidianus sulfidivorans JP7]
MKVVVFSESPPYFRMISAVAQSLNPEEIIGISSSPFKFTHKLLQYEKPNEDGLVELISSLNPDLLITGSVRRDRAVASRVAGRLKLPYIPDVITLKIDEEKKNITANRTAYSGIALSQVESTIPAVITIAGTQLQPKEMDTKIEKVQLKEGRVKTVNVKPSSSGANLATADIVVGVGRGIGSKDNVKYAEELASALGGVVGGSRPVAADLNWVPEDRQIGLSGLRIRPKLYIALGISGQPQHIAGIRDSKIIVAVNKDKDAPILENADYLVVADAVEFCKVFKEKIEQIKKK